MLGLQCGTPEIPGVPVWDLCTTQSLLLLLPALPASLTLASKQAKMRKEEEKETLELGVRYSTPLPCVPDGQKEIIHNSLSGSATVGQSHLIPEIPAPGWRVGMGGYPHSMSNPLPQKWGHNQAPSSSPCFPSHPHPPALSLTSPSPTNDLQGDDVRLARSSKFSFK